MSRPGSFVLVLHAHLPWVRHPEHDDHHEERWLYEAVAECYLPLLEVFERLAEEGAPFAATVSISPTLAAMLDDRLLRDRIASHLERTLALAGREVDRFAGAPPWGPLAAWYRQRLARLAKRFGDAAGRDLLGQLGALQRAGLVEVITCGATHGYLPILDAPQRRAQLSVALDAMERRLERRPDGVWLPECGFVPELDELLADLGVRYTFVETHALVHGTPAAIAGPYLPAVGPAGTVFLARDPEASQRVWSADEGYPGDPAYREYYRDVGFDRELEYIRPFVLPDALRVNTGLKYHRVTGKGDKEPYVPVEAAGRAEAHAAEFVAERRARAAALGDQLDRAPVMTVPFDAELFGHWWFEGPLFLEGVLRHLAADPDALVARTPTQVLDLGESLQVVSPAPSSWGDGGYSGVWLDPSNDWIQRHLAEVRQRIATVVLPAARLSPRETLAGRAATQAAREAMLAHASDWPFILKTGTTSGYAAERVEAHLRRFFALSDMLADGAVDSDYLGGLEQTDGVFPDLDVVAAFSGA